MAILFPTLMMANGTLALGVGLSIIISAAGGFVASKLNPKVAALSLLLYFLVGDIAGLLIGGSTISYKGHIVGTLIGFLCGILEMSHSKGSIRPFLSKLVSLYTLPIKDVLRGLRKALK